MAELVLVIGGTRGTGHLIVGRLLQEGYRVRALARNEARAREKLGPDVEVVGGDVTKPETLAGVMDEVDHIIFTVGVTGGLTDERLVRATVYEGVQHTLSAAREAAFQGRFLYMTAIGITKPSLAGAVLNLVKRNLLKWRQRAEEEVRRSGLDYTIIRAGILTNSPGGQKAIEVSQKEYPLAFQYRISRADVAEVFVQALRHPGTRRTTFEVVWTRGPRRQERDALFGELRPDG